MVSPESRQRYRDLLMLKFRRDLVEWSKAKNFVSSAMARERSSRVFPPMVRTVMAGSHGRGGDASKTTAANGRKTADRQVGRFIALLRDVAAFLVKRLYAANVDHIR
jgi:creatinine amidohydrolase/Fe(II)-dependent formamide hydrolase-like protein